jgi:short chain dehydrogenase
MAYLVNKVGIVTGGGTGIGKATALGMAKAGASLVIGNRNAKLGEEVVRAIEQAGGRAVFQVTDVSKPDDAKALVERAVKEFGRLDLAFNNAGMDGEQVPLHEQDIDSFRWAESVSPTKSPIPSSSCCPTRPDTSPSTRCPSMVACALSDISPVPKNCGFALGRSKECLGVSDRRAQYPSSGGRSR